MHWASSGLISPEEKGLSIRDESRNLLPAHPPIVKTEVVAAVNGPLPPPPQRVVAAVYKNNQLAQVSFPEDVDTPSRPAIDWRLPLSNSALRTLSLLVFRVQVQDDGEISAVEILEIQPNQLQQDELNELAEWLYRTPMLPAIKNGQNVPSQRVIEIAFEQ